MEPLQTREMIWSVLLSRWIDYARSAVAFPPDSEGTAWRASVAPIIELQAVTYALGDLANVDFADRPFCRDRAEVLIERAARALAGIWGDLPMPDMMLELLSDARLALEASVLAGATVLRWSGPGTFRTPEIDPADAGTEGTLLIMAPGTIALPGEPVAWWTGPDRPAYRAVLAGLSSSTTDHPEQVYRRIDDAGRFAGDETTFVLSAPPPGMPLLVPLLDEGNPIGRFLHRADKWLAMQIAAGVPAPQRTDQT